MIRFQIKFMMCLLLVLQASQLSAQTYREYMRLARYNLANTLLFQQKPKEAMKEYEQAVKLETNKARLSDNYHNMGVILQSQKQYGPAIECYKNALRNDPSDDESRYNLVLCQHLLKNSPQDQEQNQEDENKDGQGQNKEDESCHAGRKVHSGQGEEGYAATAASSSGKTMVIQIQLFV